MSKECEASAKWEVSARTVLSLLNELGITGVSGEQLKLFMNDLKKLMYYDSCQSSNFSKENVPPVAQRGEGPERLHSCSTVSSRCKMVQQNRKQRPATAILTKTNVVSSIRPMSAVKAKAQTFPEKETSKDVKKPKTTTTTATSHRKLKSSKNFIKVPVCENRKKSDPVSLYHHYSTLWEKYKTHLPGENSRADIRWSIREKLLGEQQTKTIRKVSSASEETLAKRREGWID